MFDDYPELQAMKDAAQLLAEYDQWDALYDEQQLKENTVPVFAATYIEDMYVEYDLARETARKVNGIKTFETNASKYIVPLPPSKTLSFGTLSRETVSRGSTPF